MRARRAWQSRDAERGFFLRCYILTEFAAPCGLAMTSVIGVHDRCAARHEPMSLLAFYNQLRPGAAEYVFGEGSVDVSALVAM